MKKSELRQIIREEIKKLNENSSLKNIVKQMSTPNEIGSAWVGKNTGSLFWDVYYVPQDKGYYILNGDNTWLFANEKGDLQVVGPYGSLSSTYTALNPQNHSSYFAQNRKLFDPIARISRKGELKIY
jgi:acetylornithine deacetylase/succinyl-diaminopimelate desuccinylase-like protein